MTSLYLSPTGSMLVSGSSRGLLRLWDMRGQGGRPRAAAPAVAIVTGIGPATALALDASSMQVCMEAQLGLVSLMQVWEIWRMSICISP